MTSPEQARRSDSLAVVAAEASLGPWSYIPVGWCTSCRCRCEGATGTAARRGAATRAPSRSTAVVVGAGPSRA